MSQRLPSLSCFRSSRDSRGIGVGSRHPKERNCVGFRPIRPLPADCRRARRPLVLRRSRPALERSGQRDRAGRDVRVLAGRPGPAPDRRAPGRAADRVPPPLLRGRSAAPTRAGQRRRRPRLGRVRRGASCRCDLRPRRDARRGDDERSPRRRAGNGLHAEPAALLRLAGVERGVRGDAARDRPRRSPQRDAADAACVGDDRHRSVAPDAARVLRIHPRSGVADRGRALALPAKRRPRRELARARPCRETGASWRS